MISASKLLTLECEIVIPLGYESKARASRQLIDPNEDQRRYPRQDCQTVAALKYEDFCPALRRSDKFRRIVLRNLSRCGVGFLHSEQMFPHENAFFVLPNGTQRRLKVKRCRRIGSKCYEIGAEFDQPLCDLTDGNWR